LRSSWVRPNLLTVFWRVPKFCIVHTSESVYFHPVCAHACEFYNMYKVVLLRVVTLSIMDQFKEISLLESLQNF